CRATAGTGIPAAADPRGPVVREGPPRPRQPDLPDRRRSPAGLAATRVREPAAAVRTTDLDRTGRPILDGRLAPHELPVQPAAGRLWPGLARDRATGARGRGAP